MKFSGTVGFWTGDVETSPGVHKPRIVKRPYVGNVTRNYRKFDPVEGQQNENLTVNNQLSIISDLYMQKNWPSIEYVVWNGAKWKVKTVEVGFPRLTLEIGGVWNGEEAPT